MGIRQQLEDLLSERIGRLNKRRQNTKSQSRDISEVSDRELPHKLKILRNGETRTLYPNMKGARGAEGNDKEKREGYNRVIRYAVSLPTAFIVTTALTLAMIAMISQEFKPHTVLDSMDYTIIAAVEDLPPPEGQIEIEPYKVVEVPPAPPKNDIPARNLPTIPISTVGNHIPVFTFDGMDRPGPVLVKADANPEPKLRFPPNMPSRAQKSGYCDVRFSVGLNGQPYNITTPFCTESHFSRATIKSVQKWKYQPKIKDGQAVVMDGVTSRVRFNLTDERGNIIPQ